MISGLSTVTLRVVGGDEKESLKTETVKYGCESQGTRTRKRLRWRGPAAYTRQTRPLVREGDPQKQDSNCQTVINNWSWAPDGVRHQDLLTDWLTDWPSVAMWLWLLLQELSSIQLSEVTWSSWLVSERVQLSIVSWKSSCEEKARRLVWNCLQPGNQLVKLTVDKSSARAAVTRGPKYRKLKNLPR
jgi:hypothetical protein